MNFNSNRKNIHFYPSAFQHESRVLKISRSLVAHGIVDDIVLIGIASYELPEYEHVDDSRTVWRISLTDFPLISNKKIRRILHYIEWLGKGIFFSLRYKPCMVNCHSIFDLPIGLVVKFFIRCLLIYDTHELETERNGFKEGILKKAAKILEAFSIRYIDHVFVVSESIAKWYQTTYNVSHVSVVRNIPYAPSSDATDASSKLRETFHIPGTQLIFLYLGALMPGRGIELLLKVFSQFQDKHVVFMGYGVLERHIQEYERQYPTIHLHQAVESEQILEYTSGADVGLSIIENICLSYYYCLPNKMFEYFFSGIPCIVSNFPEMAPIIERYRCGWTTDVYEQALHQLISRLTLDEVQRLRQNLHAVKTSFGWHLEEAKLLEAYASLNMPFQEKYA